MQLCTRCATLRSEGLAAMEEKFRAARETDDRDVKVADQKAGEAFQRYRKVHRECKICNRADSAFSEESRFFVNRMTTNPMNRDRDCL